MFEVTAEPFDLATLVAAVTQKRSGAIVTFAGYVRERSDEGEAVSGLHYEAHPELAAAELRAVGEEARARFEIGAIAIVHRTGELGVGELAVGVAVAAPHRGPAFDACEFAIDELKRRVPIWKQERYLAGAPRWRENG